jgi:hypothetical protein
MSAVIAELTVRSPVADVEAIVNYTGGAAREYPGGRAKAQPAPAAPAGVTFARRERGGTSAGTRHAFNAGRQPS